MGHQLVGLLASRIKTTGWSTPGARRASWCYRRTPSYWRHKQDAECRGGGSPQECAQAHQVALDVGRWVKDRVAHPSLGSQVHHLLGLVGLECRFHFPAVFEFGFDQIEGCTSALGRGLQLSNSRPFQRGIVIGVNVVEAHYRCAPLKQPCAQVKANESSSAGNQDSHKGKDVSKREEARSIENTFENLKPNQRMAHLAIRCHCASQTNRQEHLCTPAGGVNATQVKLLMCHRTYLSPSGPSLNL